jgi:ArsR family transcriptional regulator
MERDSMRAPEPPDCTDHVTDLPPLTQERFALIARGLAHPARVRIIERFEDREPLMARDIVCGCTLAQSTVSGHLRILREADILHVTKDGPRMWYCLRRALLRQFARGIEDLASDLALTVSR